MENLIIKYNLTEEWEKFSGLTKTEFLKAYKKEDAKYVSNPVAYNLILKILKDEEDIRMGKETKGKKEDDKGTEGKEGKEGQETKLTEVITPEKLPSDLVEKIKEGMTWQETMAMAVKLEESRYFGDVKSPAQAVTKILAGRELGIPPIVALSKVYIVNGKVAIQAEIMADLIKRSLKYNYHIDYLNDEGCKISFYENGKKVGDSEFTKKDAEKAGLLRKDVWQKYPRNLYFGRTLSNGARWYCPDAIHGAYIYEEMNLQIDSSGKAFAPITVEGESKETRTPTRKDVVDKLKEDIGLDKIRDIKKKLEIKGNVSNLDEKEWGKFIKNCEKAKSK